MDLRPADYFGAIPVDSYGPGFFRVGGKVLRGPVLVSGASVSEWGGPDDLMPLRALAGQVDMLFYGAGAAIAYPPRPLIAAMEALGIAVEAMATPAAARSYNVTLAEGRRVACALLPV